MPSLKEIKDRIGSVRSTLKITSAMKLVASSKLRKAQKSVETLRPYSEALSGILEELSVGKPYEQTFSERSADSRVAVVAVSSNSSLCGSFNANVLKKTCELIKGEKGSVELYPIGRKISDAAKKLGFVRPLDLNELVAHPTYSAASDLADSLSKAVEEGKYTDVLLVYNHFVSTARQDVVVETFLSADSFQQEIDSESRLEPDEVEVKKVEEKYIFEPTRKEIEKSLTPKVLSLKIFSMILDSIAAEHAARTIAMQTATDNANDLLADLTLEYNKGRQQKITAEILDIVGGSAN